ncbi:HSP20 family molecular chaperone IbpA [Tumebacillus sp. BK434]|uniref:Hsp20/alpha crystallin family protein n=1 Tax=Tumebacillus sp. BK434 TaxID=2512169 RepID=UPI001048CC7A|nr:Hsp20/alpha crystallin family protein [Tumebacillus sp. BK434]TCP59105.1 HSP20 family molecular chaperone IbpA [Tumebacillus sp. BK434]
MVNNDNGNSFDQMRGLGNMNEGLRRMFGPQFLQNVMKQLPMTELNKLQAMPDWQGMFGGQGLHGTDVTSGGLFPRIDIYQTRQEVVAVIEVPGLESSGDVHVDVQPEQLSVSGSLVGRFSNFSKDRFHLDERFRGDFDRSVILPARVRPQQARAQYRNGLLEVRMIKDNRKGQKNKGHSVPINF